MTVVDFCVFVKKMYTTAYRKDPQAVVNFKSLIISVECDMYGLNAKITAFFCNILQLRHYRYSPYMR